MAKEYVFPLEEWQREIFFKPIRTKLELLELLFETIKYARVQNELNSESKIGSIVIKVSKMSRIFYITELKSFSIELPFMVNEKDGLPIFYSRGLSKEIDSVVISDFLQVLKQLKSNSDDNVYNFAEMVDDISRTFSDIWTLIKELIFIEGGYLRYDHDQERENGKRHPLKHLDVFFSQGVSFKLGLQETYNNECLQDILDIETDCHFLAGDQLVGSKKSK